MSAGAIDNIRRQVLPVHDSRVLAAIARKVSIDHGRGATIRVNRARVCSLS